MTSAVRRLAAAAIASALCAPCASRADTDRTAILQAARSLVRVEAAGSGARTNVGTGVTIAPGKVLTNCHVTHDANIVRVARGGMHFDARTQLDDTLHDLCLLSVPALELQPVAIGRSGDLGTGQPVVAIGFTGGYELQYTDGIVKALYPMDGARVIQSSTAFTSGASGGGLFDQAGRLVGILTFRLRGGNAHFFAMPIEWIVSRIDDAAHFTRIEPHTTGSAFWQRPVDSLPLFMQAAHLEAGGRWDDLLGVAARWIADDGTSPSAWYARGRALEELARAAPAIEALERAVTLDPRSSDAWYRLGLAYLFERRPDDARRAHRSLLDLDRELAGSLADRAAAEFQVKL